MRLFTLLICLSVALLAATCRPGAEATDAPLKQLEGTWLHSYEEDDENVQVYRPNTYAFPPARGRTGFAFDRAGLFTQYDIAPTDGLEGHKGKWTAESETVLRITLDDESEAEYKLQIVSLEKDLLKVKRLPQ